MKKLNLKKETLSEITADDLRLVAGGGESQSCTPTYQCIVISGNCVISDNCTNVTAAVGRFAGC